MNHQIVSKEEWKTQRANLLKKEKAMTKERDALTTEIRNLPWVKVEKDYHFQTTAGPKTLLQLFEGKSQLVVYHFMLGTATSKPCTGCSFWADQFTGIHFHLPERDASFKVISRAPLDSILEWKKRLDWKFDWVSSHGSEFNYDFDATTAENDENPGMTIFAREGNQIYRTYYTTGRGMEVLNPTYSLLDMIPSGRNEGDLEYPQAWVKRHNEYGT